MFEGKYDIKYFLTSKTLKLKESYKDWKKIAHVYLAEKIAKRDPGNTPQSGDRIEFAVIKVPTPTDGTKLLQGDMIETPKFIKENNGGAIPVTKDQREFTVGLCFECMFNDSQDRSDAASGCYGQIGGLCSR